MWLSKLAEKISIALHLKKGDSLSNKIDTKNQNLNDSSQTNTQIAKVENLNINQGRPEIQERTLSIIEKLVDQNSALMAYQDKAKNKVAQRNQEFISLIGEKTTNLSIEEMSKLEEPDAQAILSEASIINARLSNSDLRKILADLVIKRVKDDSKGEEELKNIVYNEAIRTIAKLTNNQLKIITLNYLISRTINRGIMSWEIFNTYLNENIKPLLDFRNTDSEFQHIVYAGCASISNFEGWDIFNIFRETYSFLFFKPITETELLSLNLSEPLLKNLAACFATNGLPFKNKEDCKKMLDSISIDDGTKTQILNLYESHILSVEEAKKMVLEKTDIGKDLEKKYSESPISRMILTSVGIAVAITNYEQISGQTLNVDLWIN